MLARVRQIDEGAKLRDFRNRTRVATCVCDRSETLLPNGWRSALQLSTDLSGAQPLMVAAGFFGLLDGEKAVVLGSGVKLATRCL